MEEFPGGRLEIRAARGRCSWPGRVASMGTGGISFRPLSAWAGAVCAVLAAGCRTGDAADHRRSMLLVDQVAGAPPSLVLGLRFGSWLGVERDVSAESALESACLLEQKAEPQAACSTLGDAVGSGLESASVFAARGALYVSAGFPRAAAGDFQRAVALAPDRP